MLAATSDTIAAIATAVAPGQGGVAIVRLSGPRAEAIGRQLFRAPGQQVWDSHRVLYGHGVDPATGERVDEALLLLMRAPRSFTREDVVELHCHGGLVVVRRVLELVFAAGARPAEAGEFSLRAVLNGRLDLTRAEAIGRALFQPAGQQPWESHRVLYGHVVDPASGERLDEALLLLMRAPRSFTREDVV